MTTASDKAEALKLQGNEKYREYNYTEAIRLYKGAASLQPNEPVYLSNLSAAQLEDGQYADAFKSCTAAQLLTDPANTGLRTKLLARRSKLLAFVHADDPKLFAEASAAGNAPLAEAHKDALARRQDTLNLDKEVNRRLANAPRYRCTLGTLMEYYTVGHDVANSVFRVQYTDADDITRRHPYAERFHMQVPRDGSRFNFSALFCGIGDARHLYASLVDVGLDLARRKKSSKGKAPPNVNIHFTMIDINPTALARDLIILTLISDLSAIPTARHKSDPRALDIQLALHYAYWGAVMPPHAHTILEQALDKISASVQKAVDQGMPLTLGWLYVEPKTLKEVNTRLKWWQGEGKTAISFDRILPASREPGSPGDFLAHLQPQDREALKNAPTQRHASMMKLAREDSRARAACEVEAKKLGISVEKYIALLEKIPPKELEALEPDPHCPQISLYEKKAWKHLRVMVPPPHANEPKPLDKVFRAIRSGGVDAAALFRSPDQLTAAFEHMRKRWKPNFTMLDKAWLATGNGSVNLLHDVFQGALFMFPMHYMSKERPTVHMGSLYEWSAQFFSLAADGMTRLRECGDAFKIEVVHGDGYAIMDQIKLETLTREPAFPVQFDRVHASNVPDYVGGYLASFTTAVPLLKPSRTSYFTSCSMLNSGVWEGGFTGGRHDLNLDSALYTYAGVTRAETPAVYGVSIDCKPIFAANYHTFGRLSTASKRFNKAELAAVAYACFIKTVLPVKYERHTYGGTVREVLNVHAFFRLLEVLKGLNYPPHALAEIVESIPENRVGSSPLPHDVTPILLASRTQRATLCTVPFQAEFEVAAAMWEPRLFPICSPLIPAASDIVRYSVQFSMPRIHLEESIAPTHFVLVLTFGLPRDLDADITDIRKCLTDTRECRTSIQFLSTFHYDPTNKVATFLLSRKRMEIFVKSGYEVAILNTMFWRVQSMKIPCAKIEAVGDLDNWDKTRRIITPQGRGLTSQEMRSWERDIMQGCYGSSSTGAGTGNSMMDMLASSLGIPGMPNNSSGSPNLADMMGGGKSMMDMLAAMGMPGAPPGSSASRGGGNSIMDMLSQMGDMPDLDGGPQDMSSMMANLLGSARR